MAGLPVRLGPLLYEFTGGEQFSEITTCMHEDNVSSGRPLPLRPTAPQLGAVRPIGRSGEVRPQDV
ncbi:hypothetical protein GCM10009853_030480 [Glycomyces scopariae]